MKAAVAPTKLESAVLLRVLRGRDPWANKGSTRDTSQALGRLARKGYVERPALRYLPTELARCWLLGMQVVSAEQALLRCRRECSEFMASSAPTIVHVPGIRPLLVN